MHFYDRIVLDAVTNLCKPFGAAIHRIDIPTMTRRHRAEYDNDHHRWHVVRQSDRIVVGEFANQWLADDFQSTLEVPTYESVVGVFVDQKMRDALLKEGLPAMGSVTAWKPYGIVELVVCSPEANRFFEGAQTP